MGLLRDCTTSCGTDGSICGTTPNLASAVRADGGKIAWLCRYGDWGGQIDRIICSFKLHTVVTIWTLFTLIHSYIVYLESNHVKPQNRCLWRLDVDLNSHTVEIDSVASLHSIYLISVLAVRMKSLSRNEQQNSAQPQHPSFGWWGEAITWIFQLYSSHC